MKELRIPVIKKSLEFRPLLDLSVHHVQILQLWVSKVRFLGIQYNAGEIQSDTVVELYFPRT